MTDYRDTVFLPTTPFPMRGELPQREPEILARWDRIGLWERSRERAAGRPTFVLHDGPIYSNGNLHIGHALNRILKDVIMRVPPDDRLRRRLHPGLGHAMGCRSSGRWRRNTAAPGRDKDAVPVLDFRAECRAYSAGLAGHPDGGVQAARRHR